MRKSSFFVVLLFFSGLGLYAQTRPSGPQYGSASQAAAAGASSTGAAATTSGIPAEQSNQINERLRLAISSIDYPVTPGDIYRLTYRESGGTIQQREFQVDAVSMVDMGVFGKSNASGMTFFQLKQQVEEMIARNYTYSVPAFTITSPGVFRVAVRDGTSRIMYETAWGMTRLSEIVSRIDSSNFSRRNVERISRNERSERFDLLKAAISDQAGADPFVRSGDTVILHSAERIINLSGAVRRPGRYELVERENLRDLVEVFGGGLTSHADIEHVRIQRVSSEGEKTEYIALPRDYATVGDLSDGDTVIVSDRTAKQPVVWFEGAVSVPQGPGTGGANTAAGTPETEVGGRQDRSGRFSYNIRPGIKLSDVLYEIRSVILPTADLSAATLIMPGSTTIVPVDLNLLVSGSDMKSDIELPANSVVHIPELRTTIAVSGAVFLPGMVPYKPGAKAQYYISQCGGVNPDRNSGGKFIIFNQNGVRAREEDPLIPGCSIFVENNAFGYNLERTVSVWIPIITMLITVLTFGMTTGLIHPF